ncbi:Hypothetical protein D9617_26g078330 [Elsinoe fawcettii]|nr:Hypothetical protein D9617_26g078330 [Elsinoe fawcettii]
MAKSTAKVDSKKSDGSKASKVKVTKSQLSQERIQDSSGEDSTSSSESDSIEIPSKTSKSSRKPDKSLAHNVVAEESNEDTSDSEADSDDETPAVKDSKSTATKSGNAAVTNESTTAPEVDLDRESSVVSTSSEEGDVPAPAQEKRTDIGSQQPVEAAKPKPAPIVRYTPPVGYTELSTYDSSMELSSEYLKSKELWHITLPAGLPVSELKSIPVSALRDGRNILSHNGTDYSINEDTVLATAASSNKYLLLPDSESRKFRNAGLPVSRTMHVKSQISLPNLTLQQADPKTGSAAAAPTTFKTIDKTRPQPKGLKMRYKPPGFGTGRPGMIGSESSEEEDDSDEEMVDAPAVSNEPTFKRPGPAAPTTDSKRSKKINGSVEMSDSTPSKKRKRDGPSPAPVASEPTSASREIPSKDKKVKKRKSEAVESNTVAASPASKLATPTTSDPKKAATPQTNGLTKKRYTSYDDDEDETGPKPSAKVNGKASKAVKAQSPGEEEPASTKKSSMSAEEREAKLARKAERARQREEKEAKKRRKAEKKVAKAAS